MQPYPSVTWPLQDVPCHRCKVAIRFNRLIQSLSMPLLRHGHDQDHDHLMSIGGVGGYYLSHVCVSVPFPFSFCRLSSRLLLSCTPHPIILNLSHNRIDTVISYRIISIISYHHRNQGTIPYTLVDGTYLPLKMMLLRSCPTDNQLLFRPRSLPTKYSNW